MSTASQGVVKIREVAEISHQEGHNIFGGGGAKIREVAEISHQRGKTSLGGGGGW